MSFSEISATELREKLDRGDDFILLDVREPYEYEEENLGGQLLPLGMIMLRLNELEPHRKREIVVHCKSGNRSMVAQQFLVRQGFEKVYNLSGGLNAWNEQNSPQ